MAYDASSITVLKGLEAVRKRPAMYVGSSGQSGLHQIIYEAIDNAVDEALAGFANTIIVTLYKNGAVSVQDNGRGIPVDIHPETKKSALETVMTTLHAGGKFENKAYKVSGGLHGVGISATNALSKYMKTIVKRNGKIYKQEYERGVPLTKVKEIGSVDNNITGTFQYFEPDEQIFKDAKINAKTIFQRIKTQAYLTSGVYFVFRDFTKDVPQIFTFYHTNSLVSFVRDLGKQNFIHENAFFIRKELDNTIVEASLMYTNADDFVLKSFANNIYNPEGGTHVIGFKQALSYAINKYIQSHKLLKKQIKFSVDEILDGIVAVISVKLPDPQYEGQTKIKLNNPEIRSIVYKVVNEAFTNYLETHPQDAKAIVNKIILTRKAKEAARAAKKAVLRKGSLIASGLPGKLADCSSKKLEETELFVVEGDSAGGSAKQARDRHFQAILPLTGKPINPEKSRLDRVLQNDKLAQLVRALGCGIGKNMDIKKLRYGKIIIMTDADVDGAHIATLLLTFFFRHMKQLITEGRVYIAQPPLFKVEIGGKKHWFLTEEQKDKFIQQMQKQGKKVKSVQRFKGLGEMNPEQLWETTMNPKTRVLKKVSIEDAEQADRLFTVLMGQEVGPRRKFIEKYAIFADLDI